MRAAADLLVYSGAWVAFVALALLHASARALGVRLPLEASITVAFGALAVYTLDHQIDDHVGKTRRVRLVRDHARILRVVSAVAFVVAVAAGVRLDRSAILLLGAVVALAGVHAWLRHIAWVKPLYVALAWWAVVVGIPAVLSHGAFHEALLALAPVGAAVLANVLACDVVDREGEALQLGARRTWNLARAVAAGGALIAVAVPSAQSALALVPLALFLAVIPYRPTEAYAAWVLDGAVMLGAATAWLVLAWRGVG